MAISSVWNAPDWKVTRHNETVDTTNQTIYWTYSPDEMGKEKPPVTVRLIIKRPPRDHGGNGTIAWKDLPINWENTDTAVVAQAACGIQNCHGMEMSLWTGRRRDVHYAVHVGRQVPEPRIMPED